MNGELTMAWKTFAFTIAAITIVILKGAATASAAELPTYELAGLPVTAHQISVVGSARVEEASPAPTMTLDGMPASPHQIAVLTPHRKIVGELVQGPTAVGREVTR
jgi:hypothetical protein